MTQCARSETIKVEHNRLSDFISKGSFRAVLQNMPGGYNDARQHIRLINMVIGGGLRLLRTFCGGSQGAAAAVGGVHKGFADFSKWQEIKIHLYETCPFIVYELSRESAPRHGGVWRRRSYSRPRKKRGVFRTLARNFAKRRMFRVCVCVYTVYFRVAWAGLGRSVSSSTPFVIFFSGERQREEHNQCGCAKASFTLAIINLCQSERWRRRRQWPFYDPQHGTELLNSSSSSRSGLVQRKSADLCVFCAVFSSSLFAYRQSGRI